MLIFEPLKINFVLSVQIEISLSVSSLILPIFTLLVSLLKIATARELFMKADLANVSFAFAKIFSQEKLSRKRADRKRQGVGKFGDKTLTAMGNCRIFRRVSRP